MVETSVERAIRDGVDAHFDDLVQFTAELVKFPSTFGREQTAQDFVARELRERGYGVDRWRIEPAAIAALPGFSPPICDYENAYNVVGVRRAEAPRGRSLILNGHIDVVPEGPHEMWASPPYAPQVAGGWLHGRGAGDMKAGLGCAIHALDALGHAGFRPAADVYVQSVIEEECTGNGALACLQRGYRAEAALIPEPFDETLLSAQLGVMWFQVTVRGRPVHVARAGTGANAIEAAFRLAAALRDLETRWNEARHPAYAGLDHPINFNLGRIRGGDWASSVPAWCTFDMRIGFYPGMGLAAVRAEVEDCLHEAARADPFLAQAPPEIAYTGFQAEGYMLPAGTAAEATLEAAHARVAGAPLDRVAGTATTDARFFGLYADTPALVYGPRATSIHGFDEAVELESMRRVTQTIALFVADWCGLEKA